MASGSSYAATGIPPLCGVGVSDDFTIFVPFLTTNRGGVIWRYAERGYIEELSTDGISHDKMQDTLLERQADAQIGLGMRSLRAEDDTVPRPSGGEEDNAKRSGPSRLS